MENSLGTATRGQSKAASLTGGRSAFFRRSLVRMAGMLMLLIVMLAVYGESHAGQANATPDRIIALGLDDAGNALLKATANALYRSGDEGLTWTQIALPPAASKHDIAAVTASARNKNVWYLAGPGFGVLRSADGGQSWTARNDGLPSRKVAALATHADQADTVYAYVIGKGIFRSEDAGAHWRLMDKGPRGEIRQFVHSNMPGSMQTGWLFAAASKGVRRSMDCFCGWQDAGALATAVQAVSYDPRQPKRVYAATQKGLSVSSDGGEQWTSMKAPAAGIAALAGSSSGVLYAAAGNSLFRSRDQGATWEKIDAS